MQDLRSSCSRTMASVGGVPIESTTALFAEVLDPRETAHRSHPAQHGARGARDTVDRLELQACGAWYVSYSQCDLREATRRGRSGCSGRTPVVQLHCASRACAATARAHRRRGSAEKPRLESREERTASRIEASTSQWSQCGPRTTETTGIAAELRRAEASLGLLRGSTGPQAATTRRPQQQGGHQSVPQTLSVALLW